MTPPGPLAVIVAVTAAAAQAVLTAALGLVGASAGIYATRQSILSQRRTANAEQAANVLRERTVDREDFESVVEGLRGVIAERTQQYNDTLAELRAARDRVAQLETDRLRGGGAP